jgi:hypothetical protein
VVVVVVVVVTARRRWAPASGEEGIVARRVRLASLREL